MGPPVTTWFFILSAAVVESRWLTSLHSLILVPDLISPPPLRSGSHPYCSCWPQTICRLGSKAEGPPGQRGSGVGAPPGARTLELSLSSTNVDLPNNPEVTTPPRHWEKKTRSQICPFTMDDCYRVCNLIYLKQRWCGVWRCQWVPASLKSCPKKQATPQRPYAHYMGKTTLQRDHHKSNRDLRLGQHWRLC